MLVGAIVVAVVVAGLLVYWFVFRWDATPKRWCVMFYLTSNTPASAASVNRPDEETGIPAAGPAAATLDQKLDQVVNQFIRTLPCATEEGIAADPAWDDVYVVYRAIWDDPYRSPEARVVRPELSAPTKKYFPGETVFDAEYAIDFTKDLQLFFEWAYDNCPAQQYAVFFWGHAMGPAGFFQPSELPIVVSPLKALLMKVVFFLTGARWSTTPGLPAISDAIGSIVQQRFLDGSLPQSQNPSELGVPPINPGNPGGPSPSGASGTPVVFTVGQVIPKVDVVLFQDCWMSTLETAFELQDDVRFIVSSQSLVPAGFDAAMQLGAVWPYHELIDTFLNQPNFAGPMMQVLRDFYDGVLPPPTPPGGNRYPATKVLFSLMDCGTTAGAVSVAMLAEYKALVQALHPLGPAGRSALIEQSVGKAGRLFELSGVDLRVGDQALIDVLTFCTYLQTPAQWPGTLAVSAADQNAITAAAAALAGKLATIVTSAFQSPPLVPGDLTYTGVGVLYKPYVIWGTDPYIVNAYRSSYEKFRFAAETDVTPPPGGGTSGKSWTQYAFDRYKWF